MFVTVWLGILEISTGKLVFADAGHEKMALFHEGEWSLTDKDHTGAALGMYEPDEITELPEQFRIVDRQIILKPGDAIFQYTDGVTEATDEGENLFGEKRLMEALKNAPGGDPKELLLHIRGSIAGFVKEAEQFDDITMLGLIYEGSAESV